MIRITSEIITIILFFQQRGDAGFEKAYQQCVVACDAFLKKAMANEI